MRLRSCTGQRGDRNATGSPRNVIADVAGRKWPGDVGVNQGRCSIKQFQGCGVTLSDLLNARHSRQRLRQLVRQTDGHQYAQLFESATYASAPAAEDCLRGWVDAVLDKVFDQINLRVA